MTTEKIKKEYSEDKSVIPPVQEKTSETHHQIKIKGKTLKYKVTAGTILLKEEDLEKGEKEKASVFYIAYELEGVKEHASRPITFSFNGGPGSSSVWMHLGVLGPKRVLLDNDGKPFNPPYELVDNQYTLLEASDLVFIDPVSTGFSRTVPNEKPEQFHNVEKDIQSVGDFIRLWTTRNQRWTSPKFLIGESYGTTRAAGLSEYLHRRHGMYLNGIMLVSSILNFMTARFDPGNDLPYILFLPTYTATAWYHNKLDDDLQQDFQKTLQESKSFALNEYTLALMKGNTLTRNERTEIAQKLARYTGLGESYIEGSNLRIHIYRFCKELLRDENITIGRLDSRYTGFDRDSVGEIHEIDPSYSAILGPYSSTMNDYLRSDLQFDLDLPYEILSSVHETWTFKPFQGQYVNTGEYLRNAFQYHPGLKVIVLNGYFDLATPYLATEYTFNHIELPPEQQSNISMKYYHAGHMMYLHIPSLEQMSRDLKKFVLDSTIKG
ncbi:MAG: hypothetical protein JEZ06_06665 [Anaerolineaceae bacterium]|nr:hypothetical protein [Anaerolineaceae bacterium]